MKKIAIIGSGGQLGADLTSLFSQNPEVELYPLDHSQIELTDRESVDTSLSDIRPDVVINCAAFVRVDRCEEEVEKALSVNALGAGYVAHTCAEIGAAVVYISTDYVFDGSKNKPYTEQDEPNPVNVYGESKLKGEELVRKFTNKHFIVRSAGLYGHGKSRAAGNFVETMLKLADKGEPIRVVDDQVLTPTFTKDLAAAISELIQTDNYGTYHITNSGRCSWYEFGKAVFEISGLSPDYGTISSKEYGARAERPAYSVLDNSLVESLSITPLRSWRKALTEYIKLRKGA